jgi:U3 small nucleolar RNA-associated protein 4
MHVHDVRCIAIWPPAQPFPKRFLKHTARDRIAPVLATGGQDMSLTLTAIAPPSRAGSVAFNPFARGQAPQIEDAFYRKMPYAQLGASGGRIVQCAMNARFISCRHDTKLSIWRVLPRVPRSLDESPPENTGWNKLLEMDLKTDTTLVSSAISADGRWLAVSDAYETKLFRLLSEVRRFP